MARVATFAALCSAILGTSRAAALGSAEDYASGAVHAQIMAIKVVCTRCPVRLFILTPCRLSGMLRLLREQWTARSIQSSGTPLVKMALLLRFLVIPTIPSSATTLVQSMLHSHRNARLTYLDRSLPLLAPLIIR